MSGEKDFPQRLQRIGERVRELESIADPAVRAASKELVQLLMEMHGAALERMLEITFESSQGGTRVIDELGKDPLVSSVLVLYGLHPEDLQTRVERKLAEIRSRLYKMGAEATLLGVHGNDVRVQVNIEGHTCGSTSKNVKAAVEESIYEAAPDLTSLVVEGLEDPAASGFVAMDALMGAPATSSAARRPVATLGHDGMD